MMHPLKKGIGILGSTTIDKIIAENGLQQKLGGVTTYAGITYRRHAIPVFVASNMAEKDLKHLDKLTAENISVFRLNSDHSTTILNRYNGDRRDMEILHQARSIEFSQIQSILEKVGCLHLGPLHPLDIEPGALNSLQTSGRMVILDVQGYTRMIRDRKVFQHVSSLMPTALKLAHVAKANESEATTILDFFGMTLGQLMNRFEIEEFVVTLGFKGGFVQTRNGDVFYYDAKKIHGPCDPTGAGDIFLATYVVGRILHDKNISEACASAAKLSARQLEGRYITGNKLRN
jgi:sugar/nucleoside kinase (ribokinase family)